MVIQAKRGTIEVELGPAFRRSEATRIGEALAVLGPFTHVAIDFGGVSECDDGALVLLAAFLRRVTRGQIALSGLSHHQWRLLTYAGLIAERATFGAPADAGC